MSQPYVVAGVTGHTGRVVADQLLRAGKPVRVIVRSPEKGAEWKARGADVAVASLDDGDRLAQVLEGATAAYLLSPPDAQATDFRASRQHLTDALAAAARSSRLPHAVFLSSIGAQHPSGTGPIVTLHDGESKLRAAVPSVTFLRAAYFLENWLMSLEPAKAQGILPSFVPADWKFPMVATRDIGRLAAEALGEPQQGVRIIELAGPEDYSARDIAGAVGRLLGKPVTVAEVPLDQVQPALTSAGLSPDVARLYREMMEGVMSGLIAFERRQEFVHGHVTPEEALRPYLR